MVESRENKEKMVEHMDWHFRQNRRLKERKGVVSREWFVGNEDWINERNREEKVLPFQEEVEKKSAADKGEDAVMPYVLYQDEDLGAACGICGEEFIKYWDTTEEEWMLKDTIREGSGLMHFTCKRDDISASKQTTPTPQILTLEGKLVESGGKKRKISEDHFIPVKILTPSVL